MNRRELLAALAAGLATAAAPGQRVKARLGIAIDSFNIRNAAERKRGTDWSREPLRFLQYCHELGAGGVQLPLGLQEAAAAEAFRRKAEDLGMFVEVSIWLPRDRAGAERFEVEVRSAKQAGAEVIRTITPGGRRYEAFASPEQFRVFADRAWESLRLVEPIVARHRMRLAIENHKEHKVR